MVKKPTKQIAMPEGKSFLLDSQQMLREGRIMMLMVSQDHCPFCVLIKEEIIHPMILGGDFKDEILIREILIDLDRKLIDYSGKEVSAMQFAQKYSADITPTLLFLGPDGEELVERMVGINTPEMFFYYISESIKKALKKLPVVQK